MPNPYLTLADLYTVIAPRKLAQLSNDAPGATEPDTEVVDRAIAAASEMVDGYLRTRHPARLDPVPTIVRNLALDLACYRLYARRMESEVPETVKDQHDRAIKVLEHIQSGKVTLGDAVTNKTVPEAGAIRIQAPKAQFGETTLAQWRM